MRVSIILMMKLITLTPKIKRMTIKLIKKKILTINKDKWKKNKKKKKVKIIKIIKLKKMINQQQQVFKWKSNKMSQLPCQTLIL